MMEEPSGSLRQEHKISNGSVTWLRIVPVGVVTYEGESSYSLGGVPVLLGESSEDVTAGLGKGVVELPDASELRGVLTC